MNRALLLNYVYYNMVFYSGKHKIFLDFSLLDVCNRAKSI